MKAWIEKIQGMLSKEIEELKNKQSVMNNTIIEMKNTLEGINSRITEEEEQTSKMEERMVGINATVRNKKKG